MPAPRTLNIDLPSVSYGECWAKTLPDGSPGISVLDHCMNVGCVAEALLALSSSRGRAMLPPGVSTLAALHDVGKVSPGFQQKCPTWLAHHPLPHAIHEGDHAKISQFTVRILLEARRLEQWAAIVGAHHGKLKGRLSQEPWEDERHRLAQELIDEFGPLPDQPATDAVLWFTAGLITVADWIGSDEDHFPQDSRWNTAERRQHAEAALRKNGWNRITVRQRLSFRHLFPALESANEIQVRTQEAVRSPGVYVVEGPMGCGKTEAALAATYHLIAEAHATGLYFGLPTQVTSNRIHERVQPFVDRICSDAEPVRLAHSTSWLMPAESSLRLWPASTEPEATDHVRAGRAWFASSKRALLAPIGVGTIDQALLGIVAANHFFVRQFGLAGKVIILDEVHTYDLYTSTLIDVLVKRLRELQCTVIILSATLTERRRRELLGLKSNQRISSAYPLVSGVNGSFVERICEQPSPRTVDIRTFTGSLPLEKAMDHAQRGACVLWIRNTVDEAQETYRSLQSANQQDGPPVALLHSRFPFFRREELESDWMDRLGKDSARRPTGCILVSTQVAEQSVDIDADLLITDLAPTDMLLQRLGRLWRHMRQGRASARPEIWIQVPELDDTLPRDVSARDLRKALGKSARVYAPYVLLRSFEQWRQRSIITLPGDIRPILEATYADPASDESPTWQELPLQLEKQRDTMARQALNATSIWNNPALPDDEGVQIRYNTQPMVQLLLVRQLTQQDSHTDRLVLLNGATVTVSDRNWNFDAAKAIHLNLTRIPSWAVSTFLPNPPRWLASHVHQPAVVGLLQTDGSIGAMDGAKGMGLSYHPDEGVRIHRDLLKQKPKEYDEYFD